MQAPYAVSTHILSAYTKSLSINGVITAVMLVVDAYSECTAQ